eukprot:CAMPEP_0114564796 /NCGR_PEP_ID=MMETSP0114-20121206/13937_1 /TAXON_ID=31324 /ORGANISM="Goniomonas sp, Strain m" /LENGTH=55 /DNA_ID=CAMNT_0001750939 /DNA_START=60 /DNA_END=228 /DNA_ORIENTATION=-
MTTCDQAVSRGSKVPDVAQPALHYPNDAAFTDTDTASPWAATAVKEYHCPQLTFP